MDAVRELLLRKLQAVWQRRWIAIVTAWVICAAGWTGVMNIPDQYEANARIYVDADAVLTPLLRGVSLDTSGSELDVLQRTLLSRPNLERLVSKTDLELQLQDSGDMERMVARLATDIRVTPQTRNLFTIVYRNTSPKLALDVVQNVLATFLESRVGNSRADMENAGNFLATQIDNYERQLRDAERRRAEFRVKYIDLLPAGDGGVSRYEAAQYQVKGLRGTLEDARSRQAALTRELAVTPPVLTQESEGGGGGGGVANPRLNDLQRQLSELQLRYTDEYPEIVSIKRLIAGLKSGAVQAPATSGAAPVVRTINGTRGVPNPVFEQLKVRVVENESIIASLERQVQEADSERARLEDIARGAPGLQAEFINLNRDYDIIRRNYDELLSRREQMRIAEAADTDANKIKVQIIDPPQRPTTPVAPKRVIMLSTVLLVGMAAGVVLVLLISEIDTSFQSTEDLRSLGLPVIGGISIITMATSVWRQAIMIGTVAVAMGLLVSIYGGLIYRLAQGGGS
jgi:polysaccharide chain length determinant protein (PEP-CTERM system associated)